MLNDSTEQSLKALQELTASLLLNTDELLARGCKIDPAVASKLIRENLFESTSTIPHDKGKDLERVVDYFMANCGLFWVAVGDFKNKQHQIDHWGTFENYLVFSLKHTFGIELAKLLGESKNYIKKDLKVDIVYKVEALKLLLKAGVGVYFTRNGLTGSPPDDDAQGVLLQLYREVKGSVSVVFNDTDWNFLEANPKKFAHLLFRKIDLYQRNFTLELSADEYAKI